MNDANLDLVQVAVPRRHLMAVYGLLAKLDSDSAPDSISEPDEDSQLNEVVWPVVDLRRFAGTPTATSATIGKVLDELAISKDEYLSTTELEARTGVARANLKGAFSALTRHINKHYEARGWMLDFIWGPQLGPDVPAEGHYRVSAEQAARWEEARTAE